MLCMGGMWAGSRQRKGLTNEWGRAVVDSIELGAGDLIGTPWVRSDVATYNGRTLSEVEQKLMN
jgi:hypothetical protein